MVNRASVSEKTKRRAPSPRLSEIVMEQQGARPVWIRAPKVGVEHYTGFSRTKLYQLQAEGRIRSVSIREPGQIKGTRLFHLQSILNFIDRCEVCANTPEAA